MRLLSEIVRDLFSAAKNVIPLISVLLLFLVSVVKKPIQNPGIVSLGILFVVLGLFFFLTGISMSLLPIGNEVGRSLVMLDNVWLIVALAFAVGYASTLVEPGLRSLAGEVEEVSVGAISQTPLVHVVALGVGLGMALGVFKILSNIPTEKVIVPMMLLSAILILVAPAQYVGIAFDCASATTGPVNIPVNMAIAIGLTQVVKRSDPLLNGFGVVGLTSLGAVVTVLIFGLIRGR